MKKYIFKTVGIVLGISSIVGMTVLITAANATISPGLVIIQNSNSLQNGKYTNVGFKEAVIGTKKINNGNYVLYFGSQALESNLKFLYNVPKERDWSMFLNELASNKTINLDGNYWNAINYIKNSSQKPWVNIKNKPEFVSYVHKVDEESLLRKENFKNTLQKYLDEVVSIAPSFSNLSNEKQNKYEQMLNYVRQNTGATAGIRPLPISVRDFNTEENKKVPKWTISIQNLNTWSYSPFAEYSDLSNNKKYFNNDKQSIEFRNLWTFVKSRYPKAKDITVSEGFILGFENGQLTKKYSLSFDAETTPPPSDGGGTTPPATQPSKQKVRNSSIIINNYSQKEIDISKPSSTFYNWLEEVYGKNK